MKNDVDVYLKNKEVKVEDLPAVLKNMHKVFSEVKELHESRKETGEHLGQAEKIGASFIKRFEKEFPEKKEKKVVKPAAKKEAEPKKAKPVEKAKEKSETIIADLTACRLLIKKERNRKIKSGEIKAPVKQTRYTKLKNAFVRILKSIPGQSKENIQKTKKAVAESAKKIFEVHGWKQFDVIEKLLQKIEQQQIKKLEKAEKS